MLVDAFMYHNKSILVFYSLFCLDYSCVLFSDLLTPSFFALYARFSCISAMLLCFLFIFVSLANAGALDVCLLKVT